MADPRGARLFVFLSKSFILGGIETLALRMVNELAAKGENVWLIAPDGALRESLSNDVRHIRHSAENATEYLLKNVETLTNFSKVFIWASHPDLMVRVAGLQKTLWLRHGIKSSSISGIFHPDQIEGGSRFEKTKDRLLLAALPEGSVYFMNEVVKDTFVKRYGQRFSPWPVHKLPVRSVGAAWQPKRRECLKVVSVGRVTGFKQYNFGAPSIARKLREHGISVEWHIWGDGDQLENAKRANDDLGMSAQVRFLGPLPYSLFDETVLDADVFVGMGTAAVEAARLGVPTLISIIDSKNETYGFLHECPQDSIGERVESVRVKDLGSMLHEYSTMDMDARREAGQLGATNVDARMNSNTFDVNQLFTSGLSFPMNNLDHLKLSSLRYGSRLLSALRPSQSQKNRPGYRAGTISD